jgi:hypothetical protein
MKCIRYTGGRKNKPLGQVGRLRDDQAHDMVRQGKAGYLPKKAYKEALRKFISGKG